MPGNLYSRAATGSGIQVMLAGNDGFATHYRVFVACFREKARYNQKVWK
jgi:hypothetical protein